MIDEWVKKAHELSRSKGWYENDERTLGDILALIHSEVSEALEAYRDRGYEEWQREDGKPDGVRMELADAVIRIMDFFGARGWSLEDAIATKHAFNSTRPHRHGGKKL